MPYKGEQIIEFPQHETQNVMLLFGDNMRGKTSFLNAVRWGFYGVALGRHLREIPRKNLVNIPASDEGDWCVCISLHFEHNNKSYELNRRINIRDNVSHPRNDADFKEDVGLRIDGKPIEGDLINNEINQVMPKEVSRFFLFDGELLQEYENLLIEESKQGIKIKEHIESVLGVPALIHSRDELKVLLKDARNIQRKDAQKNDELKTFAQDQKSLQVKLESLESDLSDLRSQKEDIQEDIDKIDDLLKNTDAVQAKKLDIGRLEAEKKNHEQRIVEYQEDTQKLLKTAWKDVLANSVQPIVDDLKNKRDDQQGAIQKSVLLQGKIDNLSQSLEDNQVCGTCGQDIPEIMKQPLRDEMAKLKSLKENEDVDFEKMSALTKRIENLELIKSEGEANRIISNVASIIRHKVNLTTVENELDDLEDEIRGFDTDEIMRQREAKQRYEKQQTRIDADIDNAENAIELNSQKQAKISQLIAKSQGVQGLLSTRRVERLEQLETIFGEGIDQLRNKLRDDVEAYASQTFKKITTEQTYSGLQINQSYGLSILDQDGRVLNERSAGAEQVVALALIDGLNKTSKKKGPIIMDTPLGRLDPKHRANILKYLPDMSEQVVLLVHEGEIDSKRDTHIFASRIGARYEIKRISATQARIEKVI